MERMGLLDAEFWDLESDAVAVHLGGVAIFEGPSPDESDIADRFRSRIDDVPRLRQKMRRLRLGIARPRWCDDPAFDLSYHLRRVALPQPGTSQQLEAEVGRIMSCRLDEHRPLWEAWVIEGLEDGRWAILFKLHHSMVDGLGGLAVLTSLLDRKNFHRAVPPAQRPRRRLDGPRELVQGMAAAALEPRHTIVRTIHTARGGARYVAALRPVAPTSLTGALQASRGYRTCSLELADLDYVRSVLGGTRNDVVLALASRGFRELLLHRGEAAGPRAVRCLVPVAVSGTDGDANRVSAMLVDLPVEYRDVTAAHGAIVVRMRQTKRAHQADAAESMMSFAQHLPPLVVSAAVRVAVALPQRFLTTVVTNVPGSQHAQQLLGRRLDALYPYVPIADCIRIGVAVTSYVDKMFVGITCDRASVGDVDVFVSAIEDAMTELVKAAHANEVTPP